MREAAALNGEGEPGLRLRFGIQTPNHNTSWEDLRETWKEAEALGFDSAWVYDHLLPPFGNQDAACLEGWTTLAALATETTRIQIGVLVSGNTYRNPALLAKMATTIDRISRGRLALGVGAGWFERDHDAYGFRFGSARERAEMLEEALEIITRLWQTDHPSFRGKFYSLKKAPFAPPNLQRPRPPIIVGGQGRKWTLPLVARYADGWNAVSGLTPEGIRERLAIIRKECQRIGRPSPVRHVSALIPLEKISSAPFMGQAIRLGARAVVKQRVARSILAGRPGAIRRRLLEYARAGVTEIILGIRAPFDRRTLQLFAKHVMPEFQHRPLPNIGVGST